jgi:hypothetical protein
MSRGARAPVLALEFEIVTIVKVVLAGSPDSPFSDTEAFRECQSHETVNSDVKLVGGTPGATLQSVVFSVV